MTAMSKYGGLNGIKGKRIFVKYFSHPRLREIRKLNRKRLNQLYHENTRRRGPPILCWESFFKALERAREVSAALAQIDAEMKNRKSIYDDPDKSDEPVELT